MDQSQRIRARGTSKGAVVRRAFASVCALLAAVLIVGGIGLLASSADATGGAGNDQVCSGLDSGKIDVSGQQLSVTVTAPEGKLISAYCVKAGSEKEGDGPRYVTLATPQKTVTLTYVDDDGKSRGISHYSLSFVPEGPGEGGPTLVTPTVEFENPTCADMSASWQGFVNGSADSAGDGVTFAVTAGSVAPGAMVTVTATAETGFEFAGGNTTAEFRHTFAAVPTGCDEGGDLDEFVTPDVEFTNPTCPNPQQAGWTGTRTDVIAYTVTGSVAPGSTVTVRAEVKEAFADTIGIAEGAKTEWTHTFTTPECPTSVSPPVSGGPVEGGTTVLGPESGAVSGDSAVVPTVVDAGLIDGEASQAARTQLGQAMIAAGVALLLGSVLLRLRRSGGAHRA